MALRVAAAAAPFGVAVADVSGALEAARRSMCHLSDRRPALYREPAEVLR
jgi:hypothetical protein